METVVLILSVVLPLLPVVLFPTRFIGRGPVQTLLGAAMIVGAMLLIYFGMQAFTADSSADDPALAALAGGVSPADLAALEKLLH